MSRTPMRIIYTLFISAAALLFAWAATAQQSEKRIALVIGNAAYQGQPLPTAANDAGLIAQTLQAAGFDVVGARDLDQDALRRSFRDFLDKATGSGPDTIAFIYFAGYGLQLEGENYLVPVDARIARDTDVAASAVRASDYLRPLAALKLKASIVVFDAARPSPFARSGPPLAGGLALVEPEPGLLLAYNAAPGTVAPEGPGPYGAYAQALAELMRDGGLPLTEVFDRVRLRVNDVTKGTEVPWHASRVQAPFFFFERAPDAPPPAVSAEQMQTMRSRPIRELGPQDAYAAALERDTLQGYNDFLAAYPDDPMAKRVRAITAARREAIIWRRTRSIYAPNAYWSYLRRYPRGPHAADARRRLALLSAAFEPPPSFAEVTYDGPPPPPEEIFYVARPVLVFDDPIYAFEPPPPPPIFFLPPPPVFFLPPPPPPLGIFLLPIPVYTPVPVWVRPPVYVAPPPPNNVIFQNVHNTVVVNNTNTVTITEPSGRTRTVTPTTSPTSAQPAPGGRPTVPAAAIGPALPPSVAERASAVPTTPQQGSAAPATGTQPGRPPLGQPLPGTRGKPLPTPGTPGAGPQLGQPQPGQPATGQPLPGTRAKPSPTPSAPVIGAQPGQAQPSQSQVEQQQRQPQQIQQQRQQQQRQQQQDEQQRQQQQRQQQQVEQQRQQQQRQQQ